MGDEADAFDIWLAGFLDGEGSITISQARLYPFIYVTIFQHQRHRAVLEEIQRRYGGSIGLGQGTGRFPNGEPRPPTNCLRVDIRSQTQVTSMLRKLLPHLRIKRERAEQALTCLDQYRTNPGAKLWHTWTAEELAFLEANKNRLTAKQIATALGRSLTSTADKLSEARHQ